VKRFKIKAFRQVFSLCRLFCYFAKRSKMDTIFLLLGSLDFWVLFHLFGYNIFLRIAILEVSFRRRRKGRFFLEKPMLPWIRILLWILRSKFLNRTLMRLILEQNLRLNGYLCGKRRRRRLISLVRFFFDRACGDKISFIPSSCGLRFYFEVTLGVEVVTRLELGLLFQFVFGAGSERIQAFLVFF